MKTQDKFTNALRKVAEARDLDLIVDCSYANIGTFAFQRRDSFKPILTFPFSFDRGRASFVRVIGGKDPGPLGARHEDDARGFSGVEGEDFDNVVLRVEEILDGSGALPEEEFVRIVFSTGDVLGWANESDPKVGEETALARAREWGKHVQENATRQCSEQLRSAVLTGEV